MILSFRKISIIARFEIKTLFRSWFFRIFAALSVIILVFFDIAAITEAGEGIWLVRGIPSNIPLGNIYMLNIAQAIIAAFLATEFLKRDHKLDTTEVVYMRSMNNSDYVMGKTLGILIVFFVLNFLVLLVAGIMNLLNPAIKFDLAAYLLYPALFSLPSLIFILGLSYFLMIVIKNQAVTIVILLGYIASVLFYLGPKFHFIFDYMAFSLPLMQSDFIGFGNTTEILAQRGIYFLLGCSLIFLTIILFRRLPQSRPMTRISWVGMFLFLITAGWLVKVYMDPIIQGKVLREDMIRINNHYAGTSQVAVTDCNLDLVHHDEQIRVDARLTLINNTNEDLTKYTFTLNPGLEVTDVTTSGTPLTFTRELHLIHITPSHTLPVGSTDSIRIRYRGHINSEACYLDIKESLRAGELRLDMLTVDRRYSFVTPNYLLLTHELLWYPEAGVNYCTTIPGYHRTSFIKYSLTVTSDEKLVPFSQGKKTILDGNRVHFKPENPLTQISLVIGEYDVRTVMCDSVEYNLLTLKGHDYFEPYMNELGDTLVPVIRDLKQDYEREINLSYLFPRFSLVEVPIQFTSYPRYWTMSQETVQPEMVFLPENGLPIWQADFRERFDRQKDRAKRRNQVVSDKELQAQILGQFIRAIITTGNEETWFYSENIGYGRSAYSAYPMYINYIYSLKSDACPVVSMALESFLDKDAADPTNFWARNWRGLGDEELANLALQEKSFDKILVDTIEGETVYHVIRLKGFYLFTLLESKTGKEGFKEWLIQHIEKNKFKTIDLDTFGEILMEKYSLDINAQVDHWLYSENLPGFLIGDLRSYEFIDDDRTRYQIRFKASNPEAVEGLIMVNFRTGGEEREYFRGPQGEDDSEKRIVYLGPGQSKEIGVVLDAPPRSMTINTVLSQNIPSIIDLSFEQHEVVRRMVAFEGQEILDSDFTFTNRDEIIIDNEDDEFLLVQPSLDSHLRKFIEERSKREKQKYVGVRWWRPPLDWQFITQSGFFGKYIRSAVYTKAGSGESKAIWKTPLEEEGFYDVFCYIGDATGIYNRDRNQLNAKYIFKVFHDDGIEEAVMELKNSDDGWNFLGTYFISSDTAKVEMSNDSEGRMVVADAIKWVKQ